MPERIDAILTKHPGYGWEIESPQLPELVGGRETREALESELRSILTFGGAPDDFVPAVHWQEYLAIDGGDRFAVRVRKDQHLKDRLDVAKRVGGALSDARQHQDMSRHPRRSTGETLYVCAVYDDRIEVLTRQLDPSGDTIMIATAVSEGLLYTTALSNLGNVGDRTGWVSLGELGWDEETTVGDLIRYQQSSKEKISLLV